MPNKHYISKPTSLRWHLMAKHCLEVSRNWKNKKTEARNLPQCSGCKSMVGGLRNMLNVFINLLCTYTMPNKHYNSKPTSPRWHLMAKRCLEVSRNWKNKKTEARNLPPCGCKSMTDGLRNMLNVWITLLCTYTMPNKHYNSKPTSPRWHLMAKRCLEVSRNWKNKKTEARNLPPCGCKSMTDGLRNMLNVFITLLCTYTMPNKHYNSKPTSPRWHLMAKRCLAWKSAEITESEARNLPPCGCKSMTDGLRIVLNVFINLLCTYTMPNKHYNSKPTSPRWHLMAKRCLAWKSAEITESEARNLPPCGCKSMVVPQEGAVKVYMVSPMQNIR